MPITPIDPARRGSQVSYEHPQSFVVVQALIERGDLNVQLVCRSFHFYLRDADDNLFFDPI